MKNIIIFYLFLYSSLILCQNEVYVEYDVFYNTDRPTTKKAFLISKQKSNTYIEGLNSEQMISNSKEDPNEFSVQSKGSITYNYIDFNKKTILSKVNIKGTEYLLTEELPRFEWEIQNELKTISSYTCNKATMFFRGRKYTAWFTNDIPTNAGPWKFNGLPGLILQITDETGRYSWQATKIKSTTDDEISLPACKKCEEINLKQFVHLRYEAKPSSSILLRNLPRGTSTSYTTGPRNGIEIKFSWEN